MTRPLPIGPTSSLPAALGAVVALAWVAGAGAQEAGGGFLLQLVDPGGLMTGAPVVELVGSEGTRRQLAPVDDGSGPDVAAEDGVWSCPVPGFSDPSFDVVIRTGERSWSVSTALDPDAPKARLVLELSADGVARPGELPGGGPPPGDAGGAGGGGHGGGAVGGGTGGGTAAGGNRPSGSSGASPGADERSIGPGLLVWGLLALGIGLGLGWSWTVLGRRAPGAAALVEVPPHEPIAPRRLAAGDVAAALAGPLRGYRVVGCGALPAGTAGVARCRDDGVLPGELVAAVERLAAHAGPPPALLVTEPQQLTPARAAGPAADELATWVAGRFPLWVVDGPDGWAAWSADHADGDAAGDVAGDAG